MCVFVLRTTYFDWAKGHTFLIRLPLLSSIPSPSTLRHQAPSLACWRPIAIPQSSTWLSSRDRERGGVGAVAVVVVVEVVKGAVVISRVMVHVMSYDILGYRYFLLRK